MKNKICSALAIMALIASASASATTVNWGSITAPSTKTFGNSFDSDDLGNFTDQYNFSLAGSANAFGGTIEEEPFLSWLTIDLKSVSLYLGSTLVGLDNSPDAFDFSGLGAGSYSFVVKGKVGLTFGFPYGDVDYKGAIHFTPGKTTAVPEPSTFALAGIGLLGFAFAMRRRLFN